MIHGPSPTSDYKQILVAYDGSANAERALSRAVSLSKAHNAPLTVVLVVPPSAYEEEVKSGNIVLGRAVKTAKQALGDAKGVLRDGQPADEILKLADEQDADLIVIGRRGMSAVRRFLQGGVSSAVVVHSKCDVLVVK